MEILFPTPNSGLTTPPSGLLVCLDGVRTILIFGLLSSCAFAQAPLTKVLVSELERNFNTLKAKGDPAPYFLAYEVSETEEDAIIASDGSIEGENHSHLRLLDTTLRAGSPKFDNYRRVGNDRPRFTTATPLALDNNETALRQTVWMATDRVYRGASQRLIQLKANDKLRAAGRRHLRRFLCREARGCVSRRRRPSSSIPPSGPLA